jgi:uncharacterized membrane protein
MNYFNKRHHDYNKRLQKVVFLLRIQGGIILKNNFWKIYAVIGLLAILIMFFTYIGSQDRYSHFQRKYEESGNIHCTDYILDKTTGKIYQMGDNEVALFGSIPK